MIRTWLFIFTTFGLAATWCLMLCRPFLLSQEAVAVKYLSVSSLMMALALRKAAA
jgi:hypothetical protein